MDVSRSFLEVFVFDGVERGRDLEHDLGNRPFGVLSFGVRWLLGALEEHAVLQEQNVSVQDVGVITQRMMRVRCGP